MAIVAKIVLTGGPCAGKTTALSKIEEDLIEKGYRVFVVGESATELIKSGIRPFGSSAIPLFDFQILNVTHQLNKERLFEQSVNYLHPDTKCVIIYDRGVMDNKAYVTDSEFKKILKQLGLKELNLMDNYDMIVHLVTAADGKEEYYTLANNSARTEGILEAITLDRKTMNVWVGHSNLKIIDNSTEFDEKMNRVLINIHNLLGEPVSIRKQQKYLIDLKKLDLSFLEDDGCVKITLSQIYLDSENGIERRLRKRKSGEDNTYYLTVQKKGLMGESKIVTDRKISENDYFHLLEINQGEKEEVIKDRYAFTLNKQYFKLDIFSSYDGLAILEVEPTDQNDEIQLPGFLSVIREVTDDKNYYNASLASKKSKKTMLHV